VCKSDLGAQVCELEDGERCLEGLRVTLYETVVGQGNGVKCGLGVGRG
jgi:hypothetical protein